MVLEFRAILALGRYEGCMRFLATLLALALAAPVAPAQDAPAASTPHQTPSPPAPLAIDGEQIAWEEYAAWLVRFRGAENITAFALRRALERKAAAERIHLREANLVALIDSQVAERVAVAFDGQRERWIAELALQQLDPASYYATRLEELRLEQWTEALVQKQRTLDRASLLRVWEREYGPGGEQIMVSRLFLEVVLSSQPPGATRDEVLELGRVARARVLEKANALLAQLSAGADFAELVKTESDDPESAARGGLLDEPFLPENWPGIVGGDLTSVPMGQVSKPLYARGGYNIFRIESRTAHPLEEVRAEVEALLRAEPASAAESEALNTRLLAEVSIEVHAELERPLSASDRRLGRAVFSLDGVPVSREKFARYLVAARGRSLAPAFVDRRVIDALANAAGLSLSSVEIDTRISADTDRLVEIFHQGDRAEWLSGLAARGETEADFRRKSHLRVAHTLLAERLLILEREVTPAQVKAAWRLRYGEDGQSLDVRFILRMIPTPPEGQLTTEEQLAAYIKDESAKALNFLAKLRRRALDGEDFSALARAFSMDPTTRDLGGRGPGRFRLHTWSQEIQDILTGLSPGAVAEPFAQNSQFFLFECAGIQLVPFEEVRDELRLTLETARPSQVEVAGFVHEKTRHLNITLLPGMFGG
jgi:parvulin-like peptidyl-prolyl isomerase